MHVVSAASAFALLAATLWMMQADYADEWRGIQKHSLQIAGPADRRRLDVADRRRVRRQRNRSCSDNVDEAKRRRSPKTAEVDQAESEVDHLDGQFQMLTREVKFKRAEKDAVRADLDLEVRDGKSRKSAATGTEEIRRQSKPRSTSSSSSCRNCRRNSTRLKTNLAQLTKPRDDALAALKKHETELERLKKAKGKIDPPAFSAAGFKHWLMEEPIIEGFNGPLKLAQIWLPDLTINYGGAKDVARFDRCTTCHVNIDRVWREMSRRFRSIRTASRWTTPTITCTPNRRRPSTALWSRKRKAASKATARKWAMRIRFATHPNPDLYLTSASPHPMQKFGCTSCHEGQGSGTSFQNASHSPISPDIGEKWHEKYGYAANHFWEYPMYPKRLGEAACLKCHHNVVELGVNPKFGESAPKLFKGYELIRQYGCFGCHEINGFNSGKPIGPDMRLEPQTPEEAAASPPIRPPWPERCGKSARACGIWRRKPTRPGLKTGWQEPKRFRPETRMPQFFNLTNQKDAHAKLLQPVEIAGDRRLICSSKSEKLTFDHWAEGYAPDAERGKRLFSQRGCLACHSHDDFPGIKADFGPNLTNAHQKISSIEWLYTWLREPTRHSARTRMPNLYLEPETVNDVTIDPAADIAAFLLSNRDDEGQAAGRRQRQAGPRRSRAGAIQADRLGQNGDGRSGAAVSVESFDEGQSRRDSETA